MPQDDLALGHAVAPHGLVLDYDIAVPMSDGVTLRANIARPAGVGRWPVIVVRTPYGKDSGAVTDPMVDACALARAGYVVVTVDLRGRFASQGGGDYVPFVNDEKDGLETIAWAAALPTSTGDVFTTGSSYHGMVQWSAAVAQAPALRAIAPNQSPSLPWRSLFFRGGVLELSGIAAWFMLIGADIIVRRHAEDPQELMRALMGLMGDMDELDADGFASLPLDGFAPLTRNSVGRPLLDLIASGPDGDDAMLQALSRWQDYGEIQVPALVCGGWYDYFVQGPIDQFVGMRSGGGSKVARERTRLVVGPWTHGGQMPVVGERNFGMGSTPGAFGAGGQRGEMVSFFKEQINPDAEPSQPPVRIFVMGANRWRDEREWPIARTIVTPWYLGSGGLANSVSGDGVIGPQPKPSPADRYTYDPARPVPTCGGANLGLTELAGPRDQHSIEQRDDVLIYTSDVFTEALEVTGNVVVELWVQTDVEDTDFVARLVDVQPDGKAWNLADGILRGRYRDDPAGRRSGGPLEPGEPTLFRIEMTPTSNLFKAGHRLRLHVTSSSFPRWARNLNIWDQSSATLTDARVAHQTILHDEAHPSRVLLPIVPART